MVGLAVAAALAASCASGPTSRSARQAPAGVNLIGAAHAHTVASQALLRAAGHGEEAFAVALYQQLAAGTANFAIAPSSIATVLAMIAAGARGATAHQIVETLGVPVPAGDLSRAIGGLAQSFAHRRDPGVTLDEVDQAWLGQGRSVLASYANVLAGPFGAPLATIDFGHPAAAAATINSWFGDHTDGNITQLLDASDLAGQVALVLTDAVYLHAQWAYGFDPKLTAPAPFHRTDGGVENVPTMHLDGTLIHAGPGLGYATGPGWKAVALPYRGDQLEMDVIVPDDLATFETSLGAELATIVSSLRPTHVVLSMPKFDSDTEPALVPALEHLGIHDVFQPTVADLSGIDGHQDLYVSDVKHEVVVHVDEQGTVAAAATGGIVVPEAAPVATVVQVDEPFVYFVRDRATGAILFLGRVTDPQA